MHGACMHASAIGFGGPPDRDPHQLLHHKRERQAQVAQIGDILPRDLVGCWV